MNYVCILECMTLDGMTFFSKYVTLAKDKIDAAEQAAAWAFSRCQKPAKRIEVYEEAPSYYEPKMTRPWEVTEWAKEND